MMNYQIYNNQYNKSANFSLIDNSESNFKLFENIITQNEIANKIYKYIKENKLNEVTMDFLHKYNII